MAPGGGGDDRDGHEAEAVRADVGGVCVEALKDNGEIYENMDGMVAMV